MTIAPPTPAPRTAKQQPRKPQHGPIPKRQDNGYYADHETGDRLRSVTTIMNGGIPKAALMFHYAYSATDCAINALPQLVAASRSSAQLSDLRRWIARAPDRNRDERADIGSAVHKIIESHILDTPLPEDVLNDPEMAPYLAHFLAFVEDWQVTFTASEMVVANPECQYAGTLDYIMRSAPIAHALRERGMLEWIGDPGEIEIMGDTKTGGELDVLTTAGHHKGVYPEAGMQLSAYRKAKMCWLRDGSKVPMPPTAPVGIVLHLRPEGYRPYPALCGDREFTYFRHAQMIDEWTSKIASAKADVPVIGSALVHPTKGK